MFGPWAERTTIGYGSYAWKLEGTPSGSTFRARAFARCEEAVRSAYVANSRFVISLALSAKAVRSVESIADMVINSNNSVVISLH